MSPAADAATVAVSTYLYQRVKELGVEHILGVPGDFNLLLLDDIVTVPGLKWVGCCNELNAAYAADGYGRIKGVPGVLITTYGVGELSALNGIAGARAENVPVLHIVGLTGRGQQMANLLIHHVSPGDDQITPDHLRYTRASEPFSCATEILMDPAKCGQQIDRVIKEIVKTNTPGYLYVPADMVKRQIAAPAHPLELAVHNSDLDTQNQVVDAIVTEIYRAQNPAILVDVLTERFHCRDKARQLVDKTGFWTYTSGLGKGQIDETHPQFVGVYNGEASADGIAQGIHRSDLVIHVGPLPSDSNTGGFTAKVQDRDTIALHPLYCSVRGKRYPGIHFEPVLSALIEAIDSAKVPKRIEPKPAVAPLEQEPYEGADISQTYLVDALGKFMRPHDSLFVDSGTFQFATHDVAFKQDTSFHTQIFFSSIGFALPAALGAAIARRELNSQGRLILVEGDGSAQMTIQELGTIVRNKLNPVIFLLNNDGYSIERAIWGPRQDYNDICPNWQWTKLAQALGGTDDSVASYRVDTRKGFEELVSSADFEKNQDKCRIVEVILGKYDYPWRLRYQVKQMGGTNMALAQEYSRKHGEV